MAFLCNKSWERTIRWNWRNDQERDNQSKPSKALRRSNLTSLKLFNFVKGNFPGIKAQFMTAAEWEEEEQLLSDSFAIAKTIAGTRKRNCESVSTATALQASLFQL